MNARLQAIKEAAVAALETLFEAHAADIMDGETRAKAEGERQGKAVKFKLTFRTTLDDENHEAKHDLGWGFSFKRSMRSTMPEAEEPDPNQFNLPGVVPEAADTNADGDGADLGPTGPDPKPKPARKVRKFKAA